MDTAHLTVAVTDREDFAATLFDELAAGSHDGIGITRASYGQGEGFAHELMAARAVDLGLEVERDPAGNTYMTLAGADRRAPPVIVGSHLDSVAQGGRHHSSSA